MPQHIDTRHEQHLARHQRWAHSAERHRAAERRARERGNEVRAAICQKSAEDAERHARINLRAAKRLEPAVPRARTARRLNEKSSTDRLDRAVRLAAETPHPVVPSSREGKRQDRAALKAEQRRQDAAASDARRRRKAGVDFDPRTAAGQREIEPAKRRGADPREAQAVASVVDLGSLIRSRSDRTIERISAMRRFEDLCHMAMAGQFPAPRFERGVDVSRLPGVPDSRADATTEMQRLTARIGVTAQAVLFHRIFSRQTFVWMTGQGMGDERALQAIFLAALDGVAWFYGIAQRPRVVAAMEETLAAAEA